MSFFATIENSTDDSSELELGLESGGASELSEGQLTIDVAENSREVVIVATMAGAELRHISLHMHGDLFTIRGERRSPLSADYRYLLQECFWGGFSRTIVLPVEVQSESAQAQYRQGVLTVRVPKKHTDHTVPIEIVAE